VFCAKSAGDSARLFQGRFEIFGDFLSEDIGIGKIIRFFEASTSEPEDIPTEFTTVSPFMAWVSLGPYKFSGQEIH
jgi:hypothetical protein